KLALSLRLGTVAIWSTFRFWSRTRAVLGVPMLRPVQSPALNLPGTLCLRTLRQSPINSIAYRVKRSCRLEWKQADDYTPEYSGQGLMSDNAIYQQLTFLIGMRLQ